MKNNTNSFVVIMTRFSDLANNPYSDPTAYADALTAFGTVCARSVLKKVIDPKTKEQSTTDPTKYVLKDRLTDSGFNPLLVQMQRDLTRSARDLDRLEYANDNATDLEFTTDGEYKSKTVDSTLASAAAALARENLADGLDLVNDAIVSILDEMQKQKERDPLLPIDFERPYTVRRLKRKVWIKENDSVNGWETVETSPIREVYKAIRRAIASSKAVQADPKNGYSYIQDFVTDGDADSDPTVIYRRLPKYADLGGAARDFNGQETFYTTDSETVDRYYDIIAALNLNDRQRAVIELKTRGYGNKAIATYLGITENSVKGLTNRIRAKAEKIGFTPSMWDEMTADR